MRRLKENAARDDTQAPELVCASSRTPGCHVDTCPAAKTAQLTLIFTGTRSDHLSVCRRHQRRQKGDFVHAAHSLKAVHTKRAANMVCRHASGVIIALY